MESCNWPDSVPEEGLHPLRNRLLRVAADHPKTGASFRELLTDGRAYATGGADDDRHLTRKPLLPIAHVHFFPLYY